MIVKTTHITNNPCGTFVPTKLFISKNDEKIWFQVNYGEKPSVYLSKLISEDRYLGLDGKYIEFEIGNEIDIISGDILGIDGYRLYVNEIN